MKNDTPVRRIYILLILFLYFLPATDANAQQLATFSNQYEILLDDSYPVAQIYQANLSDVVIPIEELVTFFKVMTDQNIRFELNEQLNSVTIKLREFDPFGQNWSVEDWNKHLSVKTRRVLPGIPN